MFWKLYMYFMGLLTVFEIPSIFNGQILDLVEGTLSIVTVIGLYGFVYKKKFMNKQFWRKVFFLSVVTDLIYTSLHIYADVHSHSIHLMELLLPYIIGLVLAIPGYIGLYRYAFRVMEEQGN